MKLVLNKNHELNGKGYLLGVDNENISECITITIEYEELLNKWAYLEFKKGNNTYTTPRLDINDGVISYTLTNGLLQEGSISVQAVFTGSNNFVWKSNIREFVIKEAINAADQLPLEYPNFISEAQEILDDAQEAAQSIGEVEAHEAQRVLAEQTRAANETTRQSNETARIGAETTRGNNETTRQANEATRGQNESARALAETGRVGAEQEREAEFNGWRSNIANLNTFDYRLINLEEAGIGTIFNNQEDNTTAYSKTVPTGALPYARVNKVGGMSYLSKNLYFNNDIRATQQARITLTKPLKAGTYTMSTIVTSSDTDNSRSLVNVYDANNNIIASLYFNRNNRSSAKFTIATEAAVLYFYASLSSVESTGDTFSYENIQIELGEVATDYKPAYEGFKDTTVTSIVSDSTLAINAAIQALDGYGKGINDNAYNYIDYDRKMFVKCVDSRAYQTGDENNDNYLTDGTTTYYKLADQVETDISQYIDNNYIKVNGSVTFTNTNNLAAPSKITYAVKI